MTSYRAPSSFPTVEEKKEVCPLDEAHTPKSSFSTFQQDQEAVRGYFFFAVHSTSWSILIVVPFMVLPSTVPL